MKSFGLMKKKNQVSKKVIFNQFMLAIKWGLGPARLGDWPRSRAGIGDGE